MQTLDTHLLYSFTICSCSLAGQYQFYQQLYILVTPKQLHQGFRAEVPSGQALNPSQLYPFFPELRKGHEQNSLHCPNPPKYAQGVSAFAYLKGHEIRVSFAVAKRRLVHLSCTALHCTSRKMTGFMGHGDLRCESCDQPSTQVAVNRVKVGHSAGLCFKHVWGCQGTLLLTRPSSVVLAGGWLLAEGRDNQQQWWTTVTSAQGAVRNLWEWLPSIQQHGQQDQELAAWESLLLLLRYPPKRMLRCLPGFLGTCNHLFPGNCYCLALGSFVVLVSAWGKGCPSFAFGIDRLVLLPRATCSLYEAVMGYPGSIFGCPNTLSRTEYQRAVTQLGI